MNRFWVKHLELTDFRNIPHANVSFSPDINIISGENGQGKTNFLESLWLLSGGKSFRGSKDKDLIRMGCEIAKVKAVLSDGQYDRTFEVTVSNSNGKKGRFARINGAEFNRASILAGQFYCVVFAPSHLTLVHGPPALRRKLIDGALCQLYPGYIKTYRTFERVLEQKNSLLKNFSSYEKKQGLELLEIYNRNLTTYGFEIYRKRKEYIALLQEKACEYYTQISKGKETIRFEYVCFADTPKVFFEALCQSVGRDIKAGFSTCGVQREDLNIYINENPAKDFASQGQQRSIVLAIKLAESDILSQITGIDPVVVLDDVLSELDYSRQEYLLNHISGKQVFISSCDEERIKLATSKKYEVRNGQISECI